MEFRVLGPLEVLHDGVEVPLRGPLQRRALAVLILDAGLTVPMHRFIAAMWDGEPPATARRQVQNTVAALRRALAAADPIEQAGDGYRLLHARSDLSLFKAEVAQAKSASDAESAAQLLTTALERWRGPVLAGHGGDLIASIGVGLEESRLDAAEARFDALLALGRHRETVDELRAAAAAHPHRQQFTGRLMLALYRCGDAATALRAYEDLRARLADELGIDPDRTLRETHTAILREDPGLDLHSAPVPPATQSDSRISPALLPAALPGFTGREVELDRLRALAEGDANLVVVAGTGGIGKTTLAVHWARKAADRFPDGQLYADLQGFDPHGAAVRPESVVRRFLEAFGIPAERLPDSVAAQLDLYRNMLADRRVLVVLDNAEDAAQVRPLLPGGPGNFTLATSRNLLTGLAVTEGADLVKLDVLDREQATLMLEQRVGAARVAAEPDAVQRIIAVCGGLPLALAILATRAATQPRFPLGHFADQLDGVEDGLGAFAEDDPLTDVRAVFSWSIASLGDEAARLFRLLGLHPGPHCTLAAAASLAGRPIAAVRPLLSRLLAASLIGEPLPDRYTVHDLLRVYAGELAAENPEEAAEATGRMLDHYLRSGCVAAELVTPRGRVPDLGRVPPGVLVVPFPDRPAALAWLAAEYPVVLNLIEQSADDAAWNLAWTTVTYLNNRARRLEIIRTQRRALSAAERLRDVSKQLYSHRMIANQSIYTGDTDASEEHLGRALALCEAADDLDRGNVNHHFALFVLNVKADYAKALEHERVALEAFKAAGSELGQADARNGIGRLLAHLDLPERLDEALASCEEAIALLEGLGNQEAQIQVWDSIAYIHHRSGRTAEAFAVFERAIAIARSLNAVTNEAEVFVSLGRVYADLGRTAEARASWVWASEILEASEPFGAANIRKMIDGLPNA
ncbi:AfsR/SARP family transcriptional regulator [Glycomyces harbinensis]|uniref:DNA-binding transcriptional activator of the SARP family n=1 Tax=Glycomyces harbinensis TaxID=58114 RepID=A0A1G7A8H5_9ACTN|nr:BTAD domain-containing putative transcriptional regulator [Glycomyces harbinensis]SDE11184.1 DNA-binding transcriptional activator of the SARP family [Glycomyces harbinensis]